MSSLFIQNAANAHSSEFGSSRSSRTRSRSRSRSQSRRTTRCMEHANWPADEAQEESKMQMLSKWMSTGVPAPELGALRNVGAGSAEHFSSAVHCPKLDDVMTRRMRNMKGWSAASKKCVDPFEKSLYSLQVKLVGLSKPLLYLWNSSDAGDISATIEAAVKRWAVAFHHVTSLRRRNILGQTNPSFLSLLSCPDNFCPEETNQLLFGPKFVDRMVKEAEIDELLNSIRHLHGAPYQ